ncbi:putative inner membrane protein [Trabulsiella guamensis ATCC 49490]|uniref:Putative inner membrane protein n=1 Tax=Trabulsiella guamensis ATCC 49490 TaxID=1005994 RepID=A0A085AGY3_9ENTR|nr:anti-virulence regulator CigR family protein [Trabulsiella guamensis]KFC09478.1 putative inner membrane protein [Trabulsiella guamensis ATCC 49490]
MFKRRTFKTALAAVISLSVIATPVLANPGNGNGGGNGHGNSGGGHGNSGNSHGNSSVRNDKGNSYGLSSEKTNNGKNNRKPDHVDRDISVSRARSLAVNYGLTGYQSLPPGIAKNVMRGKPLPPGIEKKTLPASMLGELPNYPGYEWKRIGDDLVLVALSTAIVTAVLNGVFD